MADLTVELDMSALKQLGDDFKKLEGRISHEIQTLAMQTHSHILEEVQTKLHSRRQKYVENLGIQKLNNDLYVITLKEPALWIEDGMPAHSMVDDLLKQSPNNPNSKPPKRTKKGELYRVIPFEHSKGPTSQTPAQQSLTATIKEELKKRKIPYGKIERDGQGRPLSGMLHKFDIEDRPVKPSDHQPGPPKPAKGLNITVQNQFGYGHGPAGGVMQGNTGIPFLRGIRIYQRLLFNDDGTPKMDRLGKQRAQRGIMTFRIVKESHKGVKWNHPGSEGMKFLDEAADWAGRQWQDRILPEILRSLDRTG